MNIGWIKPSMTNTNSPSTEVLIVIKPYISNLMNTKNCFELTLNRTVTKRTEKNHSKYHSKAAVYICAVLTALKPS